jgi:small ligand-binding sensory domain FIST
VDDVSGWRERLGPQAPELVIMADPFSFDPEPCLRSLDAAYPGATCIGGMASGGQAPGAHALFVDDKTHREGAALLAMVGDVVIDPIVAQGCRPIGEPMIVTSCDGHLIHALEGRPPGEVLRDLHESLSEDDRRLFRGSLFVGVEMRDQVEYRAGDFLVRNIVGMYPDGSTLAVATEIEPLCVVQFHLRDAAASRDDLARCLERCAFDGPRGALLFSCVGRGKMLYGEPDHDSDRLRARYPELPIGGFFCNGEIGPVGGATFLHGYTSAFGLMRPRG